MADRAPILIVAFDAFDRGVAADFVAAGELPVIGALLSTAAVAEVDGPPGVYAGAIWPSFATALSPAGHRRYFRHQAERGRYLERDFGPADMHGELFWERLAAAGRRVCVLDVPHVRPSRPAAGAHLVDWLTHEPDYPAPVAAPPELLGELTPAPPDRCDDDARAQGLEGFLEGLAARVDAKLALARRLFAAAPYDLRLVVFGEAHCVGHQWFHVHDRAHPRHDAALRARAGDPILAVYRNLDAALGVLLADAGPDADVLVLLSHQLHTVHGSQDVIFDQLLRRLEGAPEPSYGRLKRLWHRLPAGLRHGGLLRALKERLSPALQRRGLAPDRGRRRFYAVPNNGNAGAIRVNLAGREERGLVSPGELDALCARLAAEFAALRNADSGEPVVREVIRTRDAFRGPFLDELPDLLVEWVRDRPVRAFTSPAIGTIVVPPVVKRSGDHANGGLLLARGPRFRAGKAPAMSICDLGPTVAALLGVTLEGVDGRPAPELLG